MILLVNPQSARWKFRFPLSILSLAGAVEGKYEVRILDGNFERPPDRHALAAIGEGGIRYVGITVMPGPQVQHAVPLTRLLRQRFPQLTIMWGGYFPAMHTDAVLRSGLVDVVFRGQAERAFPEVIAAREAGRPLDTIAGIAFRAGDRIVRTAPAPALHPDTLPPIPYHRIPIERYLGPSHLGRRTTVSHSSVGCPFLCGFCAVAGVYQGRWMGRDADALADELLWQRAHWGVDSVLFYDNNFFVSERRTARFAERMHKAGVAWWGEARPDTVMQFSDATLRAMRDGGCRMMFFGAESSSTGTLAAMDKGGTQTPETVLDLVVRLQRFDIVPELSFVLGCPSDTIDADIERDLAFIRRCKALNPRTEIIIYCYSPVAFDDAALLHDAAARGFRFPDTLDAWLAPPWSTFDLRRDPRTPWLAPRHVRRIRAFETTLDSAFPTITDAALRPWERRVLRALGGWRYRLKFYHAPLELRAAHRVVRYRRPQQEGV